MIHAADSWYNHINLNRRLEEAAEEIQEEHGYHDEKVASCPICNIRRNY